MNQQMEIIMEQLFLIIIDILVELMIQPPLELLHIQCNKKIIKLHMLYIMGLWQIPRVFLVVLMLLLIQVHNNYRHIELEMLSLVHSLFLNLVQDMFQL
mgnify:CR=1 FL=1